MAEKTATLSTGTLNLRFMQNARRAQQLSGVELEKAHVKDDAEWEVAPEIRKAWGLAAGGSNSDSNDDLYERSYIPFLFPSVSESETPVEEDDGTPHSVVKPRGRRKFNKHGEESSQPAEVQPGVVDVQPDQTRKTKIKSISSMAISTTKSSKKLKEPANRVIYDNSNVGVDLRPSFTDRKPSAAMSTSNTFMKPAGVDDPSAQSSRDATASSTASSARKGKRRQDNTESETTGTKKKKLSFVE